MTGKYKLYSESDMGVIYTTVKTNQMQNWWKGNYNMG